MAQKKTKPKQGPAALGENKGQDSLAVLAAAIAERRQKPSSDSRTAKLIASGLPKMSQKLIEEAAEVAIEALRGERTAVVQESADLLYNLTVLLTEVGIPPAEIWAEMDRRHALFGIAEKLPKGLADRE